MSKTSVLAILATVGIVFSGQLTPDAVAFAKAVQSGDELLLNRFVKQYPDSRFAKDAMKLAENCIVNWANGDCGFLRGTGPGAGQLNDGSGGAGGVLGSGSEAYGGSQ